MRSEIKRHHWRVYSRVPTRGERVSKLNLTVDRSGVVRGGGGMLVGAVMTVGFVVGVGRLTGG